MSASPHSRLSIVVATYEWPRALDLALQSLSEQEDSSTEIVVADDGSGAETAAVVERWGAKLGGRLRHVWQPDEGWRVARVLNLGASSARGDYLVFLGGDCLFRRGVVDAVRRAALPGWFLASKRLHLSPGLSQLVLQERVPVWRRSTARWLLGSPWELLTAPRESGRAGLLLPIRDRRRPWRVGQPEFRPPYDGYGFFMGVARADFERVNGFDMRYENWGEEDVDLAVRLRRIGLRCGWPGPRATVLHLWHEPRKGTTRSNTHLLEETKASTRVEAVEGLRELEAQESAKRVGASSSSSAPVKR